MVKDMDFDDEVERVAHETRERNTSRDVKSIINAILDSPVSSKYGDKLVEVDGKRPLDKFKNQPLDAKTMLLLNITTNALKTGDVKIAEFLMKYGGYEPPKQQQISVDLPQFIDDFEVPEDDPKSIHGARKKAIEAKILEESVAEVLVEEPDSDPTE